MNYYFYISLALLAYTTASRAQTVTPERAFAVNNGTVTLSCPADSTSWLRYNGNDLTPVIAGDGVVLRGAELIIEGFHAHTHAGKYYCIATSNGMTTVSCPAEIIHARIQASPFPVNPVDTVVNVNGTTVMTCKPPSSEPAPNIHWKKDGTDLNLQSDARLTVLATGNLYITNTQLTDEGEYQCIAYNEFTGATRRSIIGMLTVSYNLLTPVVPNVTITPANTLIKSLGESAIFECTASGFPPSEIRWEKLHSQIFPSTASVLQSGSLVIDPVTSDEGGVYRCIARNSEGEMYSDVRLEVKGPPDFTEEPSATVAMGDMSSLSWTVQDEGPVKALLFHNGRLLESMSSDSGLSITHALSQSSGGGVYQCIAEGLYGCSQSSIVVNTPQGTTQGPTTTATPQGTTQGPTTTATPQGTTQSPTTTATPQGTTQGPTTTATPQGTTQGPTTTATPQGTTQGPTTTATPQGTTQGPTTTATPQGTTQSPTTTATPQGTTQSPTTTATPQGTTQGPTTTATPQGTTQSSTTKATSSPTESTSTTAETTATTPSATDASTVSATGTSGTDNDIVTIATTISETTQSTTDGLTTSDNFPREMIAAYPDSVELNGPVEIVCVATIGAGVVWYGPSGSVLPSHDVVADLNVMNTTLIVDSPGTYTCRAMWGVLMLSTSITVTAAPLRVLVSDSLTARVGEPVELLCEGEGSGVSVEWSRVEGSLREGGVVSSSVGQVTSKYQIMAVTVADDGDYVCTVRSPYFEQPLYAIITLTVLDPVVPIGPPLLVTAAVSPSGGVLLSWQPPQTDSKLLGYKINYGNTQYPPTMVARKSTAVDKRTFGVRPDIFLEYGEVVTVVVWAYTLQDEGAELRVVVSPAGLVVSTESPTGPPPTGPPPTGPLPTDLPLIGPPLLVTAAVSPSGGVLLSWQPPQTDSKLLGYKINYGNTQYPPTMVARESTAVDKRTFGVRPDIFLEYGEVVTVVVWAYTLQDEGARLRVVVSPAGLVVPTESPTGPPPTDPLPTDLPLIGPPLILVNQLAQDGGVLLSWQPPQTDAKLLGYKINYGNAQNPPIMVARESTDLKTAYFWVRPKIFLEYGEDVTVVVWAYTIHDEGAGLRVVVSAVQQIVRSCSVSSAHTLSYTSDHPLTSLTHVCTEAHITQELDHSTANGTIALNNLLPSCSYVFRVTYEDGETVSCDYTTPFDTVDISADVHRHDNGSVSLRWILPVVLRNQPQLVVDVNWGNGWVGVVSGEHLPVAIENQKQEFIKLRFTLRDWKGVVFISVPIAPTEITTTFDPTLTSELKATDLALLYGVIFGGLLVLCAVVLVVILSLKYVQSTRRENDKVSDNKEKEREYFRRMSLERVSVNSVKRSAQSLDSRASNTTTETDI